MRRHSNCLWRLKLGPKMQIGKYRRDDVANPARATRNHSTRSGAGSFRSNRSASRRHFLFLGRGLEMWMM